MTSPADLHGAGLNCSLPAFVFKLKRCYTPKTKLKPITGAHPIQCSMPEDLTPNIRLNIGGADRDRTGGLLVANQALSQLSYSPI